MGHSDDRAKGGIICLNRPGKDNFYREKAQAIVDEMDEKIGGPRCRVSLFGGVRYWISYLWIYLRYTCGYHDFVFLFIMAYK